MHARDHFKKEKDYPKYRPWRNKVVNLIKAAKTHYFLKYLETQNAKPATLWKHLRKTCPQKQQKSIEYLQIGNKLFTAPTDVATV